MGERVGLGGDWQLRGREGANDDVKESCGPFHGVFFLFSDDVPFLILTRHIPTARARVCGIDTVSAFLLPVSEVNKEDLHGRAATPNRY